MPISVGEYAARAEVHYSAVAKRARKGEIPAIKVGSHWVISEAALNARRAASRPMSPDNARRLLVLISGLESDVVDPVLKGRLRAKARDLQDGRVSSEMMWSWVRSRAPRQGFACAPDDLPDLLADDRLIPSGVIDPRSGLASSNVVEGYVHPDEYDRVVREFLLAPSERPNVWLHVANPPLDDSGRIPVGFVIADLLDHDRPRENAAAERLIEESL